MPKTKTPYLPKPVRGLAYKGHLRINRAQLKRWFAEGNTFKGFIVGNNVHPFHFFGGWYLACTIEAETLTEAEEKIRGFEFYLDAELGDQAAIFLKKPTEQQP